MKMSDCISNFISYIIISKNIYIVVGLQLN